MILRWGTHSCLQGQKRKNFDDEQPVGLDTQVQWFFNGVFRLTLWKRSWLTFLPTEKKQDQKKKRKKNWELLNAEGGKMEK